MAQVPTAIQDANGGLTTYAYDSNLNLSRSVDPLGRATQYAYDKKGNVTDMTDPAGGQTRASYELTYSHPLVTGDPLGRSTNYGYNGTGDLTTLTDPQNRATNMGYDTFGHATSIVDPLNLTTINTYDGSNGALATTKDPLSHTTALTTDALSRVTQSQDALSHATNYSYDAANDLTQVTDALSHATNYSYTAGRASNLLSQVTDANTHSTSFGYDAQARLTTVTDALSRSKTSSYDNASQLTKTVNARGQVANYSYDKLGRLISKSMPEGSISYTYDAAGNMLGATHYNGSKLQMTYDSLNRVTQVIQTLPNGYSVPIGYSYDADGNRTQMTTPWGNFSYSYDVNNRLTSITNPQSKTFTFSYDADGRRTQMVASNGVTTNYTYDDAGRVLSITATNSSSVVISSDAYTYDVVGNRLTMTDVEGLHSYTYDNVYRLTAASHPAGTSLPIQNETFSYDAVGNRLADAQITGYTYDAANELTSNSSFMYTYDQDGNQTGRTGATFIYDSQNEIVSVTTNSVTWSYEYDSQRQRIEKSSGTAAGQTIYYVYDGHNILAMLNDSNQIAQLFTNSLSIDEPLLLHTAAGTDYTYSRDAVSVRVLTDSSGNIIETYKYLAYGLPAIQNSSRVILNMSAVSNQFMFDSRELDSETLLYRNGRRYYDPVTGRFVRADPVGGVDRYIYVFNSPENFIDPLGLYGLSDLGTDASNTIGGFGNGLSLGQIGSAGGYYDTGSTAYQTASAAGQVWTGITIGYGAALLAGTYAAAGAATAIAPTFMGAGVPLPQNLGFTLADGSEIVVPQGYVGQVAQNGRGMVFLPEGQALGNNANAIRACFSTFKYPTGYMKIYNGADGGQPLNILGNIGSKADTHLSLP